MPPARILFYGIDTAGHAGLWVTDGTAAGTSEITVTGADSNGITPFYLTVLGSQVLFAGFDSAGHNQLWSTDGTTAGTSELAVTGASAIDGLDPGGFTPLAGKLLFIGFNTANHAGLWITDGTASGTSESQINGAPFGVMDAGDLTVLGNKVLFYAFAPPDADTFTGPANLFVTDGTGAGTSLLSVTGEGTGPAGFDPGQFTVLGSRVLFSGLDSSGDEQLWSTDGTAAGTTELVVSGANANGLSPSY
jgi:ELWxxDGT repeat protein